jgi:hypothetical protein
MPKVSRIDDKTASYAFELWLQGAGLRGIGRELGISYEGIRQRFIALFGVNYSKSRHNILKVIREEHLNNKDYTPKQQREIADWLAGLEVSDIVTGECFLTSFEELNRSRYECGSESDFRDSAPNRGDSNLYIRTI